MRVEERRSRPTQAEINRLDLATRNALYGYFLDDGESAGMTEEGEIYRHIDGTARKYYVWNSLGEYIEDYKTFCGQCIEDEEEEEEAERKAFLERQRELEEREYREDLGY